MVCRKSVAENLKCRECSVTSVTATSLLGRVGCADTGREVSTTSHFSPSWLRNGNGCQITGGFCRYQVCFKEVFLPRALASLMGLVRFAGIMLAISYHLELGLCEKCVDRKPKVAGESQSWKKNRIGSSSSCGPKRVVGRLWGFLRIFPSCGAEKI